MSAGQIIKDRDGKPSSKRISGMILAGIGTGVLVPTAILSWMKVLPDAGTALAVGNTLFWGGLTLLGAGTIEHLAPGKNGGADEC